MDDQNRLMHPVPGSQVGLMHQPYGLPPVNVGVNVGVNMASLGGVDPQSGNDTENIGGRKQVSSPRSLALSFNPQVCCFAKIPPVFEFLIGIPTISNFINTISFHYRTLVKSCSRS